MVHSTGSGQTTEPSGNDFDQRRFRDVLGQYPTGVAVVSGTSPEGELLAMVVGTFSSVSLEPPLVSFMPTRSSWSFQQLRRCPSQSITVLSVEQEQAVRTLFGQRERKFEGLDWFASPSGDPILAGPVAWLDTRLEQVVEAGDHYIALCRVVAMDTPNPGAPLIFFQGGYGTFSVPSLVARMDADIKPAVLQAEAARPVLEQLAVDLGCEAAMFHRHGDELVAVASAVGRGHRVTSDLGQRVPAVAPVADVFVAFDDEPAQQQWLQGSDGDEQQLAVYRERLDFARRHGYLMSFLPPGHDGSFAGLTTVLGHQGHQQISDSQAQELRAARTWSQPIYRPRVLRPEATYDLGSLVVPVRSAERGVLHSIRLSQLPTGMPGGEALRWLARLQQAAGRVEELLS